MSITVLEKQLIAVGISVAAGCKPCTDYHLKAVRKAGASDSEIEHAAADAVAVRECATRIMEDHALAQLGATRGSDDAAIPGERMQMLVSIGAAFGVNCTASLEQYLAAAESLGISQEDVAEIVKLAVLVKNQAASHVERLVGLAAGALAKA